MQGFRPQWSRVTVALLPILLAGCTTTRMTSAVNRDLLGRDFVKLLIHGNFKNPEHRQIAEEKLCAELTHLESYQCFRSSELFPPGREHSEEEIASRVREIGIDGVLVLQPMGSGTSSLQIPLQTYTTETAEVYRNTIRRTTETHTYGGRTISKLWAYFEVILWSTADRKVAWYAVAESGGNASIGFNALVKSASEKAVNKLKDDGVLQ